MDTALNLQIRYWGKFYETFEEKNLPDDVYSKDEQMYDITTGAQVDDKIKNFDDT